MIVWMSLGVLVYRRKNDVPNAHLAKLEREAARREKYE